MAEPSLAEIAAELYALPPGEFIAARNGRAAPLRATHAALAKQVAALRKPSPAAFLVDALARAHPSELGRLLELGAELRAAQAELAGAKLAALASERRTRVRELVRLANELADPAPARAVLTQVEETLIAATVSAAAAEAVRAGLLVKPLEAVGTEVELGDAVAVPESVVSDASVPRAPGGSPTPRDEVGERRAAKRAAELERLDRRAAEAAALAEEARREEEAAAARLAEARAAAAEAVSHRDELQAALRELEDRLAVARDVAAEAQGAVKPLERAWERATRAAERARTEAERTRADAER
jgi:hypothetical protein